jgi:hypothetical protein
MTLRSRRVTILAVLAFVAATASAASDGAAAEQARTAACGPLASGMDESIGCARRPPANRSCHTL